MTDIPDDVVRDALSAFDSLPALSHSLEDMMRAAGRVFMEWALEEAAKVADACENQSGMSSYSQGRGDATTEIAAAIRSRGLPADDTDEGNPADYT